jgi:hypothetical protein
MSDEEMDDIFQQLRDDLAAVRPSPEFAAKVRMQVAAQPKRAWFGIWQVATAAGVFAIAALALVFWRAQSTTPVAPAPITVTTQNTPTSSPAAASSTTELPTVPPVAPRPAVTRQVARAPHVETRQPEVLAPADQRNALISLLASMRNRGTQVPQEVTADVDSDGRLPAPATITVPPITVQPLSPPIQGGGSRERP